MKTIEVVAAIIIKDNKYLVTKRGSGEFKGLFEFPGGKVEQNESCKDALIREIKEELELDILVNDYLCTINYSYPNFNLIMHTYFSTIINGNITLNEHEAYLWVEKENLQSLEYIAADIEVVNKILDYNS